MPKKANKLSESSALAKALNKSNVTKVQDLVKKTRPAYVKDAVEKLAELGEDDKQSRMARELAQWQVVKKKLEEDLKVANTNVDALSIGLGEYCDARKVTGFKMEGLGTFYMQIKNRPYVNNPESFVEWLDENEMGGMAKRTVHPKTLEGWVSGWLKDGRKLPPMVGNFVQKRMILRKS